MTAPKQAETPQPQDSAKPETRRTRGADDARSSATLTPEQKRIRIAELCGIKCKRCKGSGTYKRYGEHEWFRRGGSKPQPLVECDHVTRDSEYSYGFEQLFPDYLNDLNAMAEAEKVLPWEMKSKYVGALTRMFGAGSFTDSHCATAAQRADAFLATLGEAP